MKKSDRDLIDAIDSVLAIPLPASGTQSTTVRGLSTYARDMQILVPLARRAVGMIRQGEAWPSDRDKLLAQIATEVAAAHERIQGS